jgi:hypothetical protein
LVAMHCAREQHAAVPFLSRCFFGTARGSGIVVSTLSARLD